jgi:hypothetical protein
MIKQLLRRMSVLAGALAWGLVETLALVMARRRALRSR